MELCQTCCFIICQTSATQNRCKRFPKTNSVEVATHRMKRSSSQELQSSPTSWEYINICLREGRQVNCTYLLWTSKLYETTRIYKRRAEPVGFILKMLQGEKHKGAVSSIPHLLSGPPRCLWLPLVIEPSVLLPVSIVNFQEWLQMLVMCLHILVVHIDIIEIPFLLKDLFCCTCQNQRRFLEQHVAFPADQLFSPAFVVSHSMHNLFLISSIPQSGVSRHFAAWS